jgi:hypothetical protein
MKNKATRFFPPSWFVVVLLLVECDPFLSDEIPPDKQVVLNLSSRDTYYIVPTSSTVIDMRSMVEKSFSSLSLRITTTPKRGFLTWLSDYILKYEPSASFTTGHDQFIYSVVTKTAQVIKTDTIHIRVGPSVVDFPCDLYAMEDFASVKPGATISISYLDNDRLCSAGSPELRKTAMVKPAHGTIIFTSDEVIYTADAGYEGWDHVIYKISTGNEGADDDSVTTTLGLVSILVKGEPCVFELQEDSLYYGTVYLNPNRPPPAQVEFDVLNNDLICSLPSWQMNVTIVREPSIGNAQVLTDGKIRYTAGYVAINIRTKVIDSLTYRLCYKGMCKEALLTITLGSKWTMLQIPAQGSFISTWFIDENTGYVGRQESIYKTTDGGQHWTPVNLTNSNGSSSFGANDIFFFDANHGWAVGEEGLARTVDGGESWVHVNGLPGSSVFFTSYIKGYVTGTESPGTIYKTLDGGETWRATHIAAPANTMNIFDVVFTNSATGYARTMKNIIKTTDGGDEWVISFTTDSESEILSLTNAGPYLYMTWTGFIYWGIPEFVEGSFVSTSEDGTDWIPGNRTGPVSGYFPPRYAWGCALSPSAELVFAYGAIQATNQLPKIYIGSEQASIWQQDEVFADGHLVDKTIRAASVPSNKVAYLVGNNIILKYDDR